MTHAKIYLSLTFLGLLTVVCGCSLHRGEDEAPEAVEVGAMTVIQRDTPVYNEYVGQVEAVQEVALRAKVDGFLDEQRFSDGYPVTKGQVLFVIDPRPYKAALADAEARLAESESAYVKAKQDVDRYGPLAKEEAIARLTYDNAVAQSNIALASVDSMKALVEQAKLNLDFTVIRCPLDGRIGRSDIDVGNYVTAGQTVLATVSKEDPVRVYFTITEKEYIDLVRYIIKKGKEEEYPPIKLILADDSLYEHEGRIDFGDRAISRETGTLSVRAEFPNHEKLLRPGLYARVRFCVDIVKGGLLVPQRAVQEVLGKTFITLVGPGNKAERRMVTMGPRVGDLWLVLDGLKPGDKVVVEGFQKARPDTPLKVTMLTEKDLAIEQVSTNAPPTK